MRFIVAVAVLAACIAMAYATCDQSSTQKCVDAFTTCGQNHASTICADCMGTYGGCLSSAGCSSAQMDAFTQACQAAGCTAAECTVKGSAAGLTVSFGLVAALAAFVARF